MVETGATSSDRAKPLLGNVNDSVSQWPFILLASYNFFWLFGFNGHK